MWDEIAYQYSNFNSSTVEVWEWLSNFIPHFKMYVITYPCWWCMMFNDYCLNIVNLILQRSLNVFESSTFNSVAPREMELLF